MDTLTIGEKEVGFKLTLESWKRLKETSGITPANIQAKLEEDMAGTVSSIVFYGLSPKDREQITQNDVDCNVDLSITTKIAEMIKTSMESIAKDDGPKN